MSYKTDLEKAFSAGHDSARLKSSFRSNGTYQEDLNKFLREKPASKEQPLYSEEEVRGLIIKFWEQFPDKWDIDAWFNENKKL